MLRSASPPTSAAKRCRSWSSRRAAALSRSTAGSCCGASWSPAPSATCTSSQLEALIDDIESELHNSFRYEVGSRQVGDMVLVRLRELDRVAYVRFASVYKEFQDLDEFTSELKNLGPT